VGRALIDRALLKAKVRGRDKVLLLCQVDNEPMRRLARSAGLESILEEGAVSGTLELSRAELADVTEDATRGAIGNAAYATLLTTRVWTELFDSAEHASRQMLQER
jgi:hypothetical protein